MMTQTNNLSNPSSCRYRNRDMVENLYAADHPRRLAKDAMSELGKKFL